ncbi:hypothetical protein ELI43_13315 [Rhizobium leguminosarum]|jgi:hypothetical protein|uniref:hypothetical protein n=1 Tax=Rhizobium leguminosarum TaxID=384 RepID=UPI001030AF3E|nr:hypothetical protein [Rhizobium leguminosarum]TAU53706.1 hypothetical protein ELI43_13315 [Rhizobium leguminosarum]
MAIQKGLSWAATARFGIDDESGELYWDDKPVVTGKVIALQRYERTLATIAAVAALLAAIHPFGQSFGWW